jgi:hypothetical protein
MIQLTTFTNSLNELPFFATGTGIPKDVLLSFSNKPGKACSELLSAIAAGHVIEYVQARQHGLEPLRTYAEVDKSVIDCLKMLLNMTDKHGSAYYDCIALAFWCVCFLSRLQSSKKID